MQGSTWQDDVQQHAQGGAHHVAIAENARNATHAVVNDLVYQDWRMAVMKVGPQP